LAGAVTEEIRREALLPEGRLGGQDALARGKALAAQVAPGPSPFLAHHGVTSELAFKRRCMEAGRIGFHAQIGYRRLDDSRRAWADIYERLDRHGWAPDRFGICLDWSMGYPAAARRGKPRGTGLVLGHAEDFAALTGMGPVAAHFGDFVLGMPSAAENTAAAIAAGATTIGNLSQYFTFRLPGDTNDVAATLATVEALGLMQAQPVEMLVHSNLDDGYAAWFEDMASALGFAMVEVHIVETLIGLKLGHCFGHTYSDPIKRLAFHAALGEANPTPGTMLYGNTTIYGAEAAANFGALASYVAVDLLALRKRHTGHAITPIPTTEAQRIPTIDEVVDAHMAARGLTARMDALAPLFATGEADARAAGLLRRAARFKARLLDGLSHAIDIDDPAELLLALRRLGPARLERWFADPPDAPDPAMGSPFVDEIATLAQREIAALAPADRAAVAQRAPRVLVATTDVHFYGKRLIETILGQLQGRALDGGVSTDPEQLAELAAREGIGVIALSTYNGVALSYVRRLRAACSAHGIAPRVFVGGRMNEIVAETPGALPEDVSNEIRQCGAVPCLSVAEMLRELVR
jgi:methylmalonyl-CoA mutase cobalamin-binding subunit